MFSNNSFEVRRYTKWNVDIQLEIEDISRCAPLKVSWRCIWVTLLNRYNMKQDHTSTIIDRKQQKTINENWRTICSSSIPQPTKQRTGGRKPKWEIRPFTFTFPGFLLFLQFSQSLLLRSQVIYHPSPSLPLLLPCLDYLVDTVLSLLSQPVEFSLPATNNPFLEYSLQALIDSLQLSLKCSHNKNK